MSGIDRVLVAAVIAELEARVQRDTSYFPNSASASDYARHAEAMGLTTQQICDYHGSTGAYYEVWALYASENIFGAQPVALIFEDFSRSINVTYLMTPHT